LLVAGLLCGAGDIAVAADTACKPVDLEKLIAKILSENDGGVVLKVDDQTDDHGCRQLLIRILVDGTVKAITVNK